MCYLGWRIWCRAHAAMKHFYPVFQYACALLLIASSVAMVAYQVFTIADVANGLLIYVAQAFLLAGSIFGLDYYVKQINSKLNGIVNQTSKRNKKQQSSEHTHR